MNKKISKEIDLYIVTGGGKIARKYIKTARKLGASEEFLDKIGIKATRLNALLMGTFFQQDDVPCTIEDASKAKPPVVMGGTTPGHSTDAVGAMLAKEINADKFIIATDVDGIYDEDPKKNPHAKRYDSISIKKLRSMISDEWEKAGGSFIIDGIACRIIEEAGIPTYVVNGKNVESLENAIYGREFKGTRIEV
ncbi:MAG: UMP kinase [Thermoplasmata archaeon]|nr:MAG: UMP kinase [Thermoplasmata archaeon]